MAGVSDKARFYLERAAPELREFEEKEIFSRVRFPSSWLSSSPPLPATSSAQNPY